MSRIVQIAIARVFSAIVNADGIISGNELECLEDLKRKYSLSDSDFEDSRHLTFAEAAKAIKEHLEFFDSNPQKQQSFINDVTLLSFVDTNSFRVENIEMEDVDVSIHPREVLLCLALRLFFYGSIKEES